MFGIVLSALNVALAFVFRSAVVKFALYFGLFFVASEFIGFITGCGCVPAVDAVLRSLNFLPTGVLWFLNLTGFATGLTIIFSAIAVRFLIRRIPFFG
jgi:hypothetical protein